MTPNEIKRRYPHASSAFIRANTDHADTGSSGMPSKPEPVDWQKLREACGSEAVGIQYSLCHVEVEFHAAHGKRLDEDNRRYIVKPILDALVNLGFASDDKNITSETTQRMDKTDINI